MNEDMKNTIIKAFSLVTRFVFVGVFILFLLIAYTELGSEPNSGSANSLDKRLEQNRTNRLYNRG